MLLRLLLLCPPFAFALVLLRLLLLFLPFALALGIDLAIAIAVPLAVCYQLPALCVLPSRRNLPAFEDKTFLAGGAAPVEVRAALVGRHCQPLQSQAKPRRLPHGMDSVCVCVSVCLCVRS